MNIFKALNRFIRGYEELDETLFRIVRKPYVDKVKSRIKYYYTVESSKAKYYNGLIWGPIVEKMRRSSNGDVLRELSFIIMEKIRLKKQKEHEELEKLAKTRGDRIYYIK